MPDFRLPQTHRSVGGNSASSSSYRNPTNRESGQTKRLQLPAFQKLLEAQRRMEAEGRAVSSPNPRPALAVPSQARHIQKGDHLSQNPLSSSSASRCAAVHKATAPKANGRVPAEQTISVEQRPDSGSATGSNFHEQEVKTHFPTLVVGGCVATSSGSAVSVRRSDCGERESSTWTDRMRRLSGISSSTASIWSQGTAASHRRSLSTVVGRATSWLGGYHSDTQTNEATSVSFTKAKPVFVSVFKSNRSIRP